jgi:pimeloyl-ACP methyl ester carboxylesterase
MKVLTTSCRRGFNDPYFVGSANLYRDADGKELTEEQVLEECFGKRILFLLHGYRSEIDAPYYAPVLEGMRQYGIADYYDLVIEGLWAGGKLRSEYPLSRGRAHHSAKLVSDLTSQIWRTAAYLDVQTHSLGARVALEALDRRLNKWRNLFLLAPAVADDSIQEGEDYGLLIDAWTLNTHVFYSKRDREVLEFLFPIGEALTGHLEMALGYHGAEDSKKLPVNVTQHDCTSFIGGHSAYRVSPEFHALWRNALASCEPSAEADRILKLA